MPCDMTMRREMLRPALAEQGWDDDEIKQLELELELAIQKAKKESYENGETLAQQKKRMAEAEKTARKVAHERMHAKLADMMEKIRIMAKEKEKVEH